MANDTITITFGECVETHAGMMKYGDVAQEGFSRKELENALTIAHENGFDAEIVDLRNTKNGDEHIKDEADSACVLIVRNGLALFGLDTQELYEKMKGLTWDKHKFMYGRKVNAQLRYNLCFNDHDIVACYDSRETACGTTVAFERVPMLEKIRGKLPELLGAKAKGLKAEGNWYYDTKKCRINQHGDGERRIVVGFRVGASMKLAFQWFHASKPVSDKVVIDVHGGDFYAMGNKAVGNDWKKRSIYSLRHEAGAVIKDVELSE